jgi:hypothetical protein
MRESYLRKGAKAQSAAALQRLSLRLCVFAPLRLCAFAPLRLCVSNFLAHTYFSTSNLACTETPHPNFRILSKLRAAIDLDQRKRDLKPARYSVLNASCSSMASNLLLWFHPVQFPQALSR